MILLWNFCTLSLFQVFTLGNIVFIFNIFSARLVEFTQIQKKPSQLVVFNSLIWQF
jgi:hypothetical protein